MLKNLEQLRSKPCDMPQKKTEKPSSSKKIVFFSFEFISPAQQHRSQNKVECDNNTAKGMIPIFSALSVQACFSHLLLAKDEREEQAPRPPPIIFFATISACFEHHPSSRHHQRPSWQPMQRIAILILSFAAASCAIIF